MRLVIVILLAQCGGKNESKTDMRLGPELVVNGGFDADLTGWNNTENWYWGECGNAGLNGIAFAEDALSQTLAGLNVGKVYRVSWSVVSAPIESLLSVTIFLGGTSVAIDTTKISIVGNYYQDIVCGSSDSNLVFGTSNNGGFDVFEMDNVSVREVLPPIKPRKFGRGWRWGWR